VSRITLTRRTPEGGAERRHGRAGRRVPRWVRAILGIPLQAKLLGANLIILSVAVLVLFGPIQLHPGRLTDVYVVMAALIIGAAVNFVLVRLALRPIDALERVARLVSEG